MADASKTLELLLTSRNGTGPGVASTRAGVVQLGHTVSAQMDRAMGKVLNLRNLVAGGLIGAAIGRITAEGDQIKDMSDRLAVTAREYQVLTHAMALSGGAAGDVQVAFRTMASLLYDAGEEGKRAQTTMQALGINLASLKGMTPYEQFQALAQALARVEDANARAAMTQDVFGRGAQALIPMIKETGGNLDELARKMQLRGQFLSAEQVQRASAFRDSLAELNKAVSVAAFEALGQTVEGLTKRIMELVESGELKKWGEEAASTVTALATAVGRVADIIVNHKEAVIGLAASYVGLRVVLAAMDAIATVRIALYGLAAAHTAVATAATAQAAATNAAAIAKWTEGINAANAATIQYAGSMQTFGRSVAAVGGALNAVALAGAVAFAGWEIGKTIGEVLGLSDALAGLYVDGSIDQTDEAKRNAARLAAIGDRPAKKRLRVSGGAAKSTEKAESPDEQAKREWEALRQTVEAVWTAARIGQQTGDAAAVTIWEKISGAKGVADKLTAADIAAAGARLQAVLRDDADAAVQILKATADAEEKAVKESADRVEKATQEAADARQALARMDVEDFRQAALDRVSAIEEAADREAAALGKAADERTQAAAKARSAWDNLVKGKSTDDAADERRQKARERQLERRALAVIARMDAGGHVSESGKEIAGAYLGRQRAAELDAEAAEARRRRRGAGRRAERAAGVGDALSAGFARADRMGERAGLGRTAQGYAPASVGTPVQYQPSAGPGPGIQIQPPPAMPSMPAGGLESGAIVAELRVHRGILTQIAKAGGVI